MKGFKKKILIFTFIFMPITFLLGLWQLDRAEEKKGILEEFNNLVTQPPVDINQGEIKNWQPITAEGNFVDTYIYEDNALLEGRAGFKVYHLFHTKANKYIFVHRGFLERNSIKNNLPKVSSPLGTMILLGNKLEKNKNPFIDNKAEETPLIIQEFDLKVIVERFDELKDKEIYNFLFNLEPSSEIKFKSIEKPINMTSEKHIGYAIQWFGLFAILLVMTLYIGLKKNE